MKKEHILGGRSGSHCSALRFQKSTAAEESSFLSVYGCCDGLKGEEQTIMAIAGHVSPKILAYSHVRSEAAHVYGHNRRYTSGVAEGSASEVIENTEHLCRKPLPGQNRRIWFYNNLQVRGDCQSSRKSYKTSHVVG
jgi:hypothetical protein